MFNAIPVNCAVTIDLKPVALSPSQSIPFIPNTDLIEQLKIYGEDDVTVSDSIVTNGSLLTNNGVAVDVGVVGNA